VPLQGGASKYLAEILGLIVDRHIRADDRIFPWTRQRAYQVVRAAFLAVGVPPDRARPHALRHGHAVHALNNRAPLNVIQKALGHASIHTTSLYLDVTAEDVAREYSAIAW
jgi:site-specific recombinase XerD